MTSGDGDDEILSSNQLSLISMDLAGFGCALLMHEDEICHLCPLIEWAFSSTRPLFERAVSRRKLIRSINVQLTRTAVSSQDCIFD